LGGIEKVDDVLEYLAAGATAIQVGTANFVSPDAAELLADSLQHRVEEYNYSNMSDLKEKLVLKFD
jgi:dihydroorotate dehydrogenase (NAD+) catalytic subunit